MGSLEDAMRGLSAAANVSDDEVRKNVQPQYDADMRQYEKDVKSFSARQKQYDEEMVAYATKVEQHEGDMVRFKEDMAAWKASKNWLGRTKLPEPHQPAAPLAPEKPQPPTKPDSVEKRIADAKEAARTLLRAMQNSITY